GISPALSSPTGVASLLVPLGFSFLAFELLHYIIDSRSGRIQPAPLVDLAAFALFFPCRIAGPIKRYPAFSEAVVSARATLENIYTGLVRILTGLFKKVVIADLLSLTAGEISYATTPLHVWRVVFAYS